MENKLRTYNSFLFLLALLTANGLGTHPTASTLTRTKRRLSKKQMHLMNANDANGRREGGKSCSKLKF